MEPKKVALFQRPKKPKKSPNAGPNRSVSGPIPPIERAVVDRFAEMHRGNVLAAVEVGDGAAHAEDFVVARAERPSSSIAVLSSDSASRSSLQCLRISGGVILPLIFV